jgi:hypothetical protein
MSYDWRAQSVFTALRGRGLRGLARSREAVQGPPLGAVVVVGAEEPGEGDQAKKAAVLLTASAVNQVFRP